MQEFFSHCIAAILHKENFVNIALFILIREFGTRDSHHNDSNKIKGKNKMIEIHLLAPWSLFSFLFFLDVRKSN